MYMLIYFYKQLTSKHLFSFYFFSIIQLKSRNSKKNSVYMLRFDKFRKLPVYQNVLKGGI